MNGAANGDEFRVGQLSGAVNQLLVALIVAAMMTGPITILYLIVPGPFVVLMVPICFLVAIEGIVTTSWLKSDARRDVNRLQYRLAEWVFLLVIFRLTTWVVAEGLPDLSTLREYVFSPLTFFDTRFVALSVIALFSWERALTLSGLVSMISLNEAELHFYGLPAQERDILSGDRPVDPDRQTQFRSLMNNWVAGAIVLIVCAALSTVKVPASVLEEAIDLRNIARLGLQPGIMLAIVVYFLAGLWLVARQRLVILRSRWIIGGVRVQTGFERIWYGASLLLLLGIAALAALLPIGSTIGLARILAAITGAVIYLTGIVIAIFSAILYFLVNLFGAGEEPAAATAVPTAPLPTLTPAPPPTEMSETAAFVLGSSFWLIVAVMVIIAVLFYLRGRGYSPGGKAVRSWLLRFRAWLNRVRAGLLQQATAAGAAIRARAARRSNAAGQTATAPRFIRLNALQARDQILYFYLSTVRRAAERGLARKKSATPIEFSEEMKEGWPEAGADIDELTDAFLRARYSPAAIEEEETSPIKRSWKRVRTTIRSRRR